MLTLTHLRFTAVAQTAIHLDRYMAGSYLRNALASVMRRATCPETHRIGKPTPEHAATCPACWLLAAESDPGSVARAYSVMPPYQPRPVVEPGERFTFALTLYGDGFQFLPYFVLAFNEVGRVGVGPGRGSFQVEAISCHNPFSGASESVLQPGETLVRVPSLFVSQEQVVPTAVDHNPSLPHSGDLAIHFLTPTRLEGGKENNMPLKTPDFGVFFRRLLYRLDDLGRQFAGQERRNLDEVRSLYALADQVRLVDAQTRWLDLWDWSGRTQSRTPVGGLVGTAVYRSQDWQPLLPWLIFGQAVQVGKAAVRGNGAYEIVTPAGSGYWQQILSPLVNV
jgi:hypothetical protein